MGRVISMEKYPEGGEIGGWVKTAQLQIAGLPVMAIDSPIKHAFDFTPALSLFVDFDSEDAIRQAFTALSEGGSVMMPLDKYEFSPLYAWISDKFGVSWQLNLKN